MNHPPIHISRKTLRASDKCAQVVHQQQVDIRGIEISQEIIKSMIHIIGMVIIAPQFHTQENLVMWNAALFDFLPNLCFNIVDPGCINGTHAILQSSTDCVDLGIRILEGAKTEGRNIRSAVECVLGCTN